MCNKNLQQNNIIMNENVFHSIDCPFYCLRFKSVLYRKPNIGISDIRMFNNFNNDITDGFEREFTHHTKCDAVMVWATTAEIDDSAKIVYNGILFSIFEELPKVCNETFDADLHTKLDDIEQYFFETYDRFKKLIHEVTVQKCECDCFVYFDNYAPKLTRDFKQFIRADPNSKIIKPYRLNFKNRNSTINYAIQLFSLYIQNHLIE